MLRSNEKIDACDKAHRKRENTKGKGGIGEDSPRAAGVVNQAKIEQPKHRAEDDTANDAAVELGFGKYI